ncbi:MAG: hypothetical protein ACOYT8_03550 [Candidatus Dependentiae bacterium]
MNYFFRKFALIITYFAFFTNALEATQLLTFFYKPFPHIVIPEKTEKKVTKLSNSLKLSREHLKLLTNNRIAGIFSTYYGFLAASDIHGQTIFPRWHRTESVYVLVTEKISPIMMAHNTVSHWELEEGTAAKLYLFEKTEDPETKILFWRATQEPLPTNNQVPRDSVTIFAHPKYVYVPLGITLAQESPHLILPDIYIKKGLNITKDALYVLNLMHFFSLVPRWYKRDEKRLIRFTGSRY